MNKDAAFTICSRNYLGLALALKKSFLKFNPETDFFIFIADEYENYDKDDLDSNILIAKQSINLSNELWLEMSFKYDIVEFCTAIKPFCFFKIFDIGYEKAIYFDPDILHFDSLIYVFQELNKYSVIVVPHEVNINSDNPQRGGIYNLGFIALKKSIASNRLLVWWGDRLKKHAFSDPIRGFFTDQKWMDHLSIVLNSEDYLVCKHLGLNYAPWNFDEREVFIKENKYYIKEKDNILSGEFPLVFFHYSGFKYEEIPEGNFKHKTVPMENREKVLYDLINLYGNEIVKNDFLKYLPLSYSYNNYDNGKLITLSHRRIYARLINEGVIFKDPFISNGEFYRLLKSRRFIARNDINVDRLSLKKITRLKGKIKLIDSFFCSVIFFVGYDRFSLFARFLIRYFHLYNRARLLDKTFRDFEIESF